MRKQLRGVVTSDKNAKTIRVVVERRYRHTRYGKIVRGRTVCHTHDEKGEARIGDVVEIVECRPRSALKRWELVEIVNQADQTQVAATAEVGRMGATESVAPSETVGESTTGGEQAADSEPAGETVETAESSTV